MIPIRTMTLSVFILFLLTWPTLTLADFQAGKDAYDHKDYATALTEWRPLAEQGNANAQARLGHMYDRGIGVPQDYGEALHWSRLAAEQGAAFGQLVLGSIYWLGHGVKKDYIYAHMWLNLAGQDIEDARKLRNLVAIDMAPEQIAEAQRLAREWLTQHQK